MMSEILGSVAARQAPETNIRRSYLSFQHSDELLRDSLRRSNSQSKLCQVRSIIAGMIGLSSIVLFGTLCIFIKKGCTSEAVNYVNDYFEKPAKNQLNVLPEYEVERYVFPATLSNFANSTTDDAGPDSTIMYRIPSGPKSPRNPEKRVSYIQHGILCDPESCTVNKLQIALVYLLVDQGYDVWLGQRNSSVSENLITNEGNEQKGLEYAARCIFTRTNQTELLVMGHFNGTMQVFAMSTSSAVTEQSKLSKWLEYIPGMKAAKRLYYRGKNYLMRGYKKMVDSIDSLGRKIDFISDDPSVTSLRNTVLRAWGIIATMVAPTFGVNDFSKMINHPDVYLDTPQLITKYGYTAELHHIKTEDGYLLTVHRISGGKKYPPAKDKPVVFLQHGILSSSAVWVLMGPSKSLAYLLADEGYDVWMGNSRGNTYSQAHVNLSIADREYWNFSFHEMGLYDLPATIDYIIATTRQKKIHYVGHSQGTTSFFVMLSERPEYNDKINGLIAYAPIIFASNVRSPIINFFSKISSPIYEALQLLNVHDFLPTNALLTKIGRQVCEARSLYQVICSNALFMVTGYDSAQINKTIVPIILGHLPAGSSVKQLLHFGQEFHSKKFRQFDYYKPEKNRAKYGQSEPPEYKISNVKIPVVIFYSNNDWLADSRDVEKLRSVLPDVRLHKVPMELFNHIDFMFAMDAPFLVYHPTIEYLQEPLTRTER